MCWLYFFSGTDHKCKDLTLLDKYDDLMLAQIFKKKQQEQDSIYNIFEQSLSIRFLDAKVNVVNVESLKKAGDIDNETIHDNDDKIVVGVLLPRQLEANNDVVAKEHGVTRRQIVIKIILAHF